MKKFLSLILALLMTVSCASFAFANDAALEDTTTAVEEETPYDDAIEYLQAVGIFKGYEDGLLHAEKDIRRFEMALLAARIATGWIGDDNWLNGNANDTEFTDLDGEVTEKYLGALSYASQMGLIEGYGDGTFKPYDNISYRDVLTIACRLIGYKNLKYPWGFIEKAVNLGLTEGIEGVSYTEPLTRGGVAQVLYNALFTEVNNTTLAAELFGVELAWADIMVVANDRYVLAGHKANVAGAGKVAIQTLVNNNTAFGEDVWYVDAAQYDLEVGQFYRALFSQEIGGGNSTLVKAEPYGVVGSADNNGLGDMSNVKAYIGNAVVLSHTANAPTFTIPGAGNEKYAYDYVTGHIYNITNDGKLNGIAYYYSKDLDMYFKQVTDDAEVIYRPVDELDIMDLLKDWFHDKTATGGIGKLDKAPDDTAYSHVDVVNATNGKKVAYYEDYQLGIYAGTSSSKCKDHGACDCTADKSATLYTFKTVALGGFSQSSYTYCGGCESHIGYKLVGTADAGDYVIYGVNDITKEIKIVKVIDGSEEDSYVARGIVRGYRMTKGYVTIGDQNLYYNYNELKGNAISIDLTKADVTAAYAEVFADLVNNYVEYLVVDGKLMWIDTINDGGEDYIIVENVAGFDNEGYFVIGGYSTSDWCYDTYRIAAIDQWKNGDAYWWNTVSKTDFAKGDVYEVTSYDDSNDTYYIKKGALTGDTVVIDTCGDAKVAGTNASYVVDYNQVTINGKQYGMSASDRYVFINSDTTADDKPITLYKGTLPTGMHAEGKLVGGSIGSGLIVLTNVTNNNIPVNAFDFSMAVVLNKTILDMVYEGADGADWYIMGAMQYELEVFDLYEAAYRTVYSGYNLDLEDNKIYPIIDDMIINEDKIAWDSLDDYYASAAYRTAVKYWVVEGSYKAVTNFATLDAQISREFGYVNNQKFLQNVDTSKAENYRAFYVDLSADKKTVDSIQPLSKVDLGITEYVDYQATLIYDKEDKDIVLYVYADSKTDNTPAPHAHAYTADPAVTTVEIPGVTEEKIAVRDETELWAIVNWVGTKTKTTPMCECGAADEAHATYSSWKTIEVESVEFAIEGAEDFEHAIIADKGYFFGINDHAGKKYDASYTVGDEITTVNSGLYADTYGCTVEGCALVNVLEFAGLDIILDQTAKTEDIPQSVHVDFDFGRLGEMEIVTVREYLANLYSYDKDAFWAEIEKLLGDPMMYAGYPGYYPPANPTTPDYTDELEAINASIKDLAGKIDALAESVDSAATTVAAKIDALKKFEKQLAILDIIGESVHESYTMYNTYMEAGLNLKLSPANGLVVTVTDGFYYGESIELAH